MIIDAMDLLYANRFDGFCLVSSDSDFTRLAVRIRESRLVVYGVWGAQNSSAVCHRLQQVHLRREPRIMSHSCLGTKGSDSHSANPWLPPRPLNTHKSPVAPTSISIPAKPVPRERRTRACSRFGNTPTQGRTETARRQT